MCAEEVKTDPESVEMQPEVEGDAEAAEVSAVVAEEEAVVEAVAETEVVEALAEDEASAVVDDEAVDAEADAEADKVLAAEEPQVLEIDEAASAEPQEAGGEVAADVDVEVDAESEAAEGEAESEPESAEAEIEIPDDGRSWYVIHCYSGYEAKVRHNLEQRIETMQMQDQIFQVVVPTEDEIEVRDGKRRVVERRVFPGYILVQMLLNDDSWYVVRNTPGVTGFVGMGNDPTPLRPEEVQGIMKRMEAEAPKIKVTFRPGQKVRIIDGPFNEFIGVVDEIDMERAKVRVLVSFFGRETPVELDFLQVEKT
jgi:transcriptional antiterminator NusG